MKISIDISYYPLNQNFREPIKAFIADLQSKENISVRTNSMSTQVFGEFDDAMKAVNECIKNAFELPKASSYSRSSIWIVKSKHREIQRHL